jgi:O-antigen/teichoic acid export membrane protein
MRAEGTMATPLVARGLTLLLNNAVGQGLAFLASLAIARVLGVTGFGAYAAVMALVFVFGMVAEAGLEASLTREVARDPTRSRALLLASLRAKAVIGGCLAIALALGPVARALAPSPTETGAVRLAGVLLALNAANSSIAAVFRAWGRMHYVLQVNLTGLAVQLAGVVAVLFLAPTVTALVTWLILVQVGELLGGAALFRRGERDLGTAQAGSSASATALVRRSLPFALAGVLGALQLRVDLFLIEVLRGTSEVAVFSAATRLLGLLTLAPASFFAALFPALAAAHGESGTAGGERLYARALRRMALAGSAATTVGIVLADVMVFAAFGRAYAGAALPMRVLALQAVPLLLNTTTTLHLYATGREGLANRVATLNVALRLVVGCALVPLWGAAGAAGADLVAETAVLAVYRVMGVMRTRAAEPVLEEVGS